MKRETIKPRKCLDVRVYGRARVSGKVYFFVIIFKYCNFFFTLKSVFIEYSSVITFAHILSKICKII